MWFNAVLMIIPGVSTCWVIHNNPGRVPSRKLQILVPLLGWVPLDVGLCDSGNARRIASCQYTPRTNAQTEGMNKSILTAKGMLRRHPRGRLHLLVNQRIY
jgi:hypothetical protein